MAWTSPRTWVAAETVTAALLNLHVRDNLKAIGDPWTSYTPVLTNWGLGNGTLTGRAMQAGKLVHFVIDLTLGSTSTMVGNFVVSLPATPRDSASQLPICATAYLLDSSAPARRYWQVKNSSTAGAVNVSDPSDVGVNGTVPWTWATSDRVYISGSYEAA